MDAKQPGLEQKLAEILKPAARVKTKTRRVISEDGPVEPIGHSETHLPLVFYVESVRLLPSINGTVVGDVQLVVETLDGLDSDQLGDC